MDIYQNELLTDEEIQNLMGKRRQGKKLTEFSGKEQKQILRKTKSWYPKKAAYPYNGNRDKYYPTFIKDTFLRARKINIFAVRKKAQKDEPDFYCIAHSDFADV